MICRPLEVDELMRRVPPGRVTTINHIRTLLAARHGATVACPITTGIFASIAAHAAEEATRRGETDVTPYWRTLRSDGQINPKYPGGVEGQAKRLKREGLQVIQKGQRSFVGDFERHLAQLDLD